VDALTAGDEWIADGIMFDDGIIFCSAPAGATGRDLRAWQRETWQDADFGDTLWA
jgi:hypothetical protein